MAHIDLPPLPGIAGLLAAHPHTAGPLNDLAETLLRGPSPLTPAQRETIAAHVSRGNGCEFCARTHGAVARELGGADAGDATLRSLLVIADRVRVDGRSVTEQDVAAAREAGADDRAIHDTVLIAAAFSMFNRYVDGLATALPADPADYDRHASALAAGGYLRTGTGPAGSPGQPSSR
ncbi:carboxymuconolactone decarboxylase family protein [Actinoplanes sp. NPDC023714]|uniref:carboxymuconolactone decarboxylase family protein n=1 Tax=Actinoplanes sp. NPDC023714 TaxID=3154322 RepID=UPI0033D8FA02